MAANGGSTVNDGTYKMGKGKISDPNVTFIATDKDWVAICQRPTQRHLGLFYRAAKGSRRSGSSQKTRRNVSLEFRFCGDPDVRRWIGPLRLLSTEEIEISLDCAPCACNDLKRA